MKPLAWFVVAALAALAALTGCARHVDGAAATGPRDVDPGEFFAGDILTYGQPVSPADRDTLAYLRAMRRIDPCGLPTREALAKIGEIGSVGTLLAFDECDIDIKVPGDADRRFASIEVALSPLQGIPVVFSVGGLPVYEAYAGSCDYLLPLDLSRLPGAPPLDTAALPVVRIGLIAEDDCGFAKRLTRAIAPRVEALDLPLRHAVGAYPLAVAERDPCQTLSVVRDITDAEVDRWDVDRGLPYECVFTLRHDDVEETLRVSLKPQLFDLATETRERRDHDGVELLVDEIYCSAAAFIGPRMQRKLVGGDFVDTGDVDIRPVVAVDSDGHDCDVVVDVTAAAAKLYG